MHSTPNLFYTQCKQTIHTIIKLTSFVINTSPISSTSILSRPTGPKDVLTILATANAAVTLPTRTS